MKGKKIINLVLIIFVFFVFYSSSSVQAFESVDELDFLDVNSSCSKNILDSKYISESGEMDKYIKNDGAYYILFMDKGFLYSSFIYDFIYKVDGKYTKLEGVKGSNVYKIGNYYMTMLPICERYITDGYDLDKLYAVRLRGFEGASNVNFDLRRMEGKLLNFGDFTKDFYGLSSYVSSDSYKEALDINHIVIGSKEIKDFSPSSFFIENDCTDNVLELEETFDYNEKDMYLKDLYTYTLSTKDSAGNVSKSELKIHIIDNCQPTYLSQVYYIKEDYDLNFDNFAEILAIKDDVTKQENLKIKIQRESNEEEFKNNLINKIDCAYDFLLIDEAGNEASDTIGFYFLSDSSPDIYVNKLSVSSNVYDSWNDSDYYDNMLSLLKITYPKAKSFKVLNNRRANNGELCIDVQVLTEKGVSIDTVSVLKSKNDYNVEDKNKDTSIKEVEVDDNLKNNTSTKESSDLVLKIVCSSIITLCFGLFIYMFYIKKI